MGAMEDLPVLQPCQRIFYMDQVSIHRWNGSPLSSQIPVAKRGVKSGSGCNKKQEMYNCIQVAINVPI
jgi:hypothetical protein